MDSGLVRNRYQIKNIIGEGGVAIIYEGLDTSSNEKIAIKAARKEPACVEALLSEYRFLSLHHHPSLAGSLRLLRPVERESDTESALMIMPLLNGFSLENINIDANASSKIRKSFEEIAARLLEGAAFIHFCGYIYNDFKPANLFCDFPSLETIDLKLIDFNLVTPAGSAASKRGTIEYVAPEILQGQPPTLVSDIYSIGATLYELLTGKPPFQSSQSDDLIKQISEHGSIDFSAVPAQYRDGLMTMLSRNPETRPLDARDAAIRLGLEGLFIKLLDKNVRCYLQSGKPPFWKGLFSRFSDFLNHKSEKIFALKGYEDFGAALDSLSAEYECCGYLVERIRRNFNSESISKSLEYVNRLHDNSPEQRIIVLIDDLNRLKSDHLQILRSLIRTPRLLPVAGGIPNGIESSIPVEIFNPFKEQTKSGATREVLQAFLKHDISDIDYKDLSCSSGGDPWLISAHILESCTQKKFDLIQKQGETMSDAALFNSSAINDYLESQISGLESDHFQTISFLSCWEESIPMILLAELSNDQVRDIEKLLTKGLLLKSKDSIELSSDDLRRFIYARIEPPIKASFHRLWGDLTEKYIEGDDELIEKSAIHWGQSDNIEKGYNSNLKAASHFLQKSELSRAFTFANKSIELAQAGAGPVTKALMVRADIAKQMGDYQSARKSYLQLLRQSNLADDSLLEAEAYKDIGDLYRSMKKPRKALYYIEKAQEIFLKLGIKQEVANCHNNKGLIFWVGEKYKKALESFDAALELNSQLGNFKELSKIYSNIGIIRDIMGDISKVAENFEIALSNARLAEDAWLEALITNNLGYFHLRQNELARSKHCLQEALAISKRIGYSEQEINSLANLGLCFLRQGELFQAVECNRQALQMAETLGNPYLVADSNLHLSEVCIEMANFKLADQALKSVENDNIYSENKSLKIQTLLLRARWLTDIGDYNNARQTASDAGATADSIENPGIKLEADIIQAKAIKAANGGPEIERLSGLAIQAQKLGIQDLFCQAALLIAETYLSGNDYFNCEGWLLKSQESEKVSHKMKLESRIALLDLMISQSRYNEALGELIEIESGAASSGFMQIALRACLMQADIYDRCGKISKGKETVSRFLMYGHNIMSALPDHSALNYFLNSRIMQKLKNVENQLKSKEICSV